MQKRAMKIHASFLEVSQIFPHFALRVVPELNVWEGRVTASFFFYMGGWFLL
jgi:hypothetical protein